MKLELKHLAAYLPYTLHCIVLNFDNEEKEYILDSLAFESYRSCCFVSVDGQDLPAEACLIGEERVKPLLIPLSQLGEQYPKTVRGIRYVDEINKTCMYSLDKNGEFYDLPEAMGLQDVWETFDKLFEQHFDVFGLIDAGLALNKLDYEK